MQAIAVGSGLTQIEIEGREPVQLDLIEATIRRDEIFTECQGKTDYSHLRLFAAWIEAQTGWKPTLAQTQALLRGIELAVIAAGKEHADSLNSLVPTPA